MSFQWHTRHASRWLILSSLLLGVSACKPEATDNPPPSKTITHTLPSASPEFQEIYGSLTASCMPCHNRATLPQVIQKVQAASFQELDGETRVRILAELEELQQYMKGGVEVSFTGKEELHRFFDSTPGEFYMMLEKGIMPPPWAHALMDEIKWPGYRPLSIDERVKLMQYSKPYTEEYLR